MAHQQVQVAEAQVNARQTDLTDMVVRAPFDGIAISKDAQPGEMISPVSAGGGFTRTGICTIVDMSSLEIEVDVNETYINRVRSAQRGRSGARRLSRLAGSRRTSSRRFPSADRQKATVKVRIGFDQLDPRILPDMGVKVSFLRDERAGRGGGAAGVARMVVPKAAVRTSDGRHGGVRRERRPRRAPGDQRSATRTAARWTCCQGSTAGERVVARRARRR